jgi:hypothetical protein
VYAPTVAGMEGVGVPDVEDVEVVSTDEVVGADEVVSTDEVVLI